MGKLYMKQAEAEARWEKFHFERGLAINTYGRVEQALSDIFRLAADTDSATAGLLFFRFNNSQVRASIVGKLLERQFDETYRSFRRSLLRHLKQLDERRNRVVHWQAGLHVFDEGRAYALSPPNYWERLDLENLIYEEDLVDFREECDFWFAVLSHLALEMQHPEFVTDDIRAGFASPIKYPLPEGHPWIRNA